MSTPNAGATTPPRRLVVLAPNWLGDAVMALPLVADVRRRWPDTLVAVAGRGSVSSLFGMVDGVNDVLPLQGSGWVAGIAAAPRNARRLAKGDFDTALVLPNSFHAAWLASRAGIPERWGYATDSRRRLLTRAVPPPRGLHQAEYYQALGAALGVASGPRYASVTVPKESRARAGALLAERGLADDHTFVAMAPGAAYGRAKQWLPERFAELASLLWRERGLATALVGSITDVAVCRTIVAMTRDSSRGAAIDLSGRTDLTTLAGVLSLAEAVIANDSGAMHLAGAVGTRVVAIFGATDSRQTAPLCAGEHARAPAIVSTDVWCRPCMLRECPIDHRCMRGVSARRVFEAFVE